MPNGSSALAVTELVIERLGFEGDGLAREGEGWHAVPFTLPGERVRPDGIVLVASPERVAPVCRHFGTCGMCAVQHLAPAPMLEWKRDMVRAAFRAVGLTPDIAEPIPVPLASRRRVTFTAFHDGQAVRLGYQRRRSHETFAVRECPILVPAIPQALPALERLAAIAGPPHRMLVTACENGLDVCLLDAREPDGPTRKGLNAHALRSGFVRLSVADEVLVAREAPRVTFGTVPVTPPPGGFLQATRPSEEAMAALVTAHLAKAKRTLDLHAGCGTFALRLKGRVRAVDAHASSLAALDAAARAAGRNVVTETRDLDERPIPRAELERHDALVLDPPRAGAAAQCAELAGAEVPRVAYVSCNPTTLARDAKALIEGGHRLASVTPIDQFLFSSHVEAVALFERPKARKKRPIFG